MAVQGAQRERSCSCSGLVVARSQTAKVQGNTSSPHYIGMLSRRGLFAVRGVCACNLVGVHECICCPSSMCCARMWSVCKCACAYVVRDTMFGELQLSSVYVWCVGVRAVLSVSRDTGECLHQVQQQHF